jgi:hypothetical protein
LTHLKKAIRQVESDISSRCWFIRSAVNVNDFSLASYHLEILNKDMKLWQQYLKEEANEK